MSKKIRVSLTVAGAVIIALVVVLFSLRGTLLRAYVNSRIGAIEQKYSVNIDYSKLAMNGLSGIAINGLSLQQIGSDTLLTASTIELGLNPLKLLIMQLDIKNLALEGLHIQFIKHDSTSNYDFLYKDLDSVDSLNLEKAIASINFSRRIDRICGVLFGLLPSKADINDLRVSYVHNQYNLAIALKQLTIQGKKFSTEIMVTESDSTHCLIGEGEFVDDRRYAQLKLYPKTESKFTLPFLEHRFGATVSFDTITFNLVQERVSRGLTDIIGRAAISGLSVKHAGLSPNAIVLESGEFDYKLHVGNNYIELDSSTVVKFNAIEFNPYVLAERGEKWHLRVSVDKDRFDSDALFSSLPQGLFLNLEGIKTEGELSYHLLFDVDMAQIDSLKLESQLLRHQFRIKQFGNTDFRRMNDAFTYTAYENGVALRSFEIGNGNPNFRELSAISPLLQMAVMQSEDGAFFSHNGFLIDCLRDALINDIKTQKFARGGSTISMQLVKNVFLSRHKTIARKAEEALIVWLIEGNRLCSKERMFEVYLNIIEWGPMIYGACEASRFYFDKEPSQLTLNESIFLASVIPSPKRALNSFDENMQLKSYFEGSYRILGERLVVKGLISEEQAAELRAEVTLRGVASEMVMERNAQRIINDSLTINSTELLK